MSEPSGAVPAAVERPRERLLAEGARSLSDAELVALLLGTGSARLSARAAAVALLEAVPLAELAWAPPDAMAGFAGVGTSRAAALAAAFELGRRGAWVPPRRGERCLDPRRVFELMRHAAHAEREGFHVVLLDVRGRLIRAAQVAEGSLSQCPVSPRDALRPAVREGAHSIVFCHNHPSGVMRRHGLCGPGSGTGRLGVVCGWRSRHNWRARRASS
ncbi:MAG TPA: JAB domain-containing protein [Anaeromyxobacter sp.]